MGYLKKPVEKEKRASAQRLMKSQQLVRSRFCFGLPLSSYFISKIDLEPYTRGCLAARPYLVRGLCTKLVTTKRRSQERKEGLEPSTSALARLCSTIKLFPPATVVAKHY